ncbi:DUF362 domain-containing protein [Clostridium sp. PL3]|uniref:DUF362 domain-containing protein n=1 Tax=Clostridium thailandense TaxID=2794346 RepID=A0A949TQ31_9CLOT|nr:DUF362 domain-containing protein [Clostridium thailandense]MBV7273327.1 DUF362 domain-containing protein [Clostridium thailandense]
MEKKSIVAIAKDSSIELMVNQVLEELGGAENLIRKNSTVILKPNAGHLGAPGTSINTHPELLRYVIRAVRAAGAKRVIVGEAAAIGCDTMACFESAGHAAVAREEGAELYDIKSDKDLITVQIRDARSDIKSIRLPRLLLEAEHIINLPIFKSHASMVFSCALKNIKGVVQDKVHYEMHKTNLAMAMMDVWSVVRADLTIADLIYPAEGFGPHSAVPLDMGCVVASKDPVALDATACRMVGLDINVVDYFKAAKERGLGVSDEDKIITKGKSIDEVYKKAWLPYLEKFETWPEYNIMHENSCSSCQSLVAFSMEKLKALGEYEKNKDAIIVLGAKKELPDVPKERLILCGNCLTKWRSKGVAVHGCPPSEPHIAWAVIDREDQTEIGEGFRERMAAEEPIWNAYIDKIVKEKRKEE